MVFTGAKMAILIGGLVNTVYIGMLIFAPKAIPIYIFSVFIGISGGLVWVGQGTLLIINSTKGIGYPIFRPKMPKNPRLKNMSHLNTSNDKSKHWNILFYV